jgi:hypothetical protein
MQIFADKHGGTPQPLESFVSRFPITPLLALPTRFQGLGMAAQAQNAPAAFLALPRALPGGALLSIYR